MVRYLACLILPAALWLGTPSLASAQVYYPPPPDGWEETGIAGPYYNVSGGGQTFIHQRGRGYVFVNEQGSRAFFVYSGPNQLRQVSGEWDPSVRATVSRDRQGRTVIRFSSPYDAPGYWVSAD